MPAAPTRWPATTILLSRAAPVLMLALTAAVTSVRLGTKGLWHDEAFTLAVARSDGDTFWRSLLEEESFAGLYYSMVRLLPPLWGSEAALRVPSVVFSVLAALACYALGKRLFGQRVAVFSVLLLSVNLFFIRYAQEARAYALALWLVALAAWLLLRAVERPTWPRWLGLGAICALAVYAHFFAVLALAGYALSLLLHRSLVPWPKAAAAAGLGGALVAPLAVVLLRTNAGGRPKLGQSSIAGLLLDGLAGAAPTRFGVAQIVIYGLCGVAAVAAWLRQRRRRDQFLQWRYTLLFCWAGAPIALGALISSLWPVFVTRYFIVCLPALVLLVAVGLSALRPVAQAALLLVVLVVGAHGLPVYYAQDYKEGENWRGLVRHVAQEAEQGDRVLFLSRFGRRPFEYYVDRHSGLAPSLVPEYPALPWGGYPPVTGEAAVGATAVRADQLESAAPARVWVVLLWGGFQTGDDDGAPFQQLLTREYVRTEHRFYGRYLKLALFERR